MAKVVIIQSEEAGQRIDNFIFKHLKGVPKVRVYRAIRGGEVRVNQGRIKPEYRVQLNDKVRIPPLTASSGLKPAAPRAEVSQAILQRIVYEDAGLLVIDKPPGLPVHGGSGLQGGVIELLRMIRPELRFLELIHRLDRETSGCLLLAKKRQILLEWHDHLTRRQVHKQYLTLVKGEWQGGPRRVEAPLLKNTLSGGERIVRVCDEGKAAVTHFRPLKVFKGMTLVEAYPQTGRTHQIRVHLQHIDYPIAADAKYGDADFNREVRRLGLKRLFLHAASISCAGFGICVPMPTDLREFLKKLPLTH
jgi:23S rRNA pseudouridine955/2504/2580 synthase